MTSNFIVYDPLNGRIKHSVQCPSDTMLCGPDEAFFLVTPEEDIESQYVVNNTLVKRPTLAAYIKLGRLYGVPKGAQIRIEEDVYEADGSTIELGFVYPGTYVITVMCWPYIEWQEEITV